MRFTSLLIGLTMLVQIPFLSIGNGNMQNTNAISQRLSVSETSCLSQIDETLCNNYDILELKKADVLDDFISEVKNQKEIQVEADIDEALERIQKWGLSAENTVNDIRDMAQEYLNINFNAIQIGSQEFDDMVRLYIETDAMGTDELADNEIDFGPLYVFMCIYDEYFLSENIPTIMAVNNNQNVLGETSILNIIESDCESNFSNTEVRRILGDYVQAYAEPPVWPAMNGFSIESYARMYADYPNTNEYQTQAADCTNFVSQVLFYGYLPKTFYESEKNANGFIETESRWFYFKNSSSKQFSASTSWVRVSELYNYLSPHYAVFETSNGSQMTPYLNRGFVLQGKPFIGAYKHTVVVTITNGQTTYCAHSNSRNDEPISSFYNGFSKYRVIQTY